MSLVGLPEQITDDPKTYDKVKPKGDLRGLPTAIVYSTKVARPMTPIHDLMKEDDVTDERLRKAVADTRAPAFRRVNNSIPKAADRHNATTKLRFAIGTTVLTSPLAIAKMMKLAVMHNNVPEITP